MDVDGVCQLITFVSFLCFAMDCVFAAVSVVTVGYVSCVWGFPRQHSFEGAWSGRIFRQFLSCCLAT